MNSKELQAFTLVGPTCQNPVLNPPSCTTPQQPTINDVMLIFAFLTPSPSAMLLCPIPCVLVSHIQQPPTPFLRDVIHECSLG